MVCMHNGIRAQSQHRTAASVLGPVFVFYINDNWNTALSLVTWTKMFFLTYSAVKPICNEKKEVSKGAQWHWPRQQDRARVQKPRV